jgi:hypothetical protein
MFSRNDRFWILGLLMMELTLLSDQKEVYTNIFVFAVGSILIEIFLDIYNYFAKEDKDD